MHHTLTVTNNNETACVSVNVPRDLSICAICKTRWTISKSRMRNVQISDLDLQTLTITLILTLNKSHSAVCKFAQIDKLCPT